MKCTVASFLVVVAVAGCSDRNSPASRDENIDYLKNTLGVMILGNRDANGEVFESFSAAHAKSGMVLPNRGDLFGQTLVYRKTGPESFHFHSYGVNRKDDGGVGDDIVVTCENGHWTL